MMPSAPRRTLVTLSFCAIFAVGSSLVAATPQEVLREAQEMLAAGLPSAFVLSWLEGSAVPPARPTAEQAIALREAGASDELLMRLLEMATEEVPKSGLATADQALEPGELPSAGRPIDGDGVPVTFLLSYAPRFDEGRATWDLYVYLDGRPLSYVPEAAGSLLSTLSDPLFFERRLAPGRHRLRVTQERHGRRGASEWRHQARVAAESFEFELHVGVAAEIEIRFEQGIESLLSGSGPLTYRVHQGGQTDELEGVGDDPEGWAEICEDLEHELREWKESRRERRMQSCAPWASLWDAGAAPSREAVWEALAIFDFRPVPRSSHGLE